MNRPSLRKLFVASFSGRLIYALASLASLPFLAKILGVEAIGLIGFYNTLLMVLMVLEGGLTSNLVNLIARMNLRIKEKSKRYQLYIYSVVNTYLISFFLVAVLCASGVIMLSPYLAENWLEVEEMEISHVIAAVRWMGLFVGLNFLVIVAQAVLIGSERQIEMNFLYVIYALFRTVGAVVLLWLVEPARGAQTYFQLQVIFQVFYLFGLLFFICRGKWGAIVSSKPSLRFFIDGSSYSRDIFLLSITSVVAVQFDKLYLSAMVSLTDFAAYSLAGSIANLPYIISSAIYSVLFPRFTANIAMGLQNKVDELFRAAACAVTIFMSVFCIAVVFFSVSPLKLLFESPLAENVAQILPLLMIGVAIQSLLMVPFAIQLADRWTSLALRMNLLLVPFFMVALPILVKHNGAVGAAHAWLIYNIISLIGTMYFFLKRFKDLCGSLRVILEVFIYMVSVSIPVFFLLDYSFLERCGELTITLLVGVTSCSMIALGFYRFRADLLKFY